MTSQPRDIDFNTGGEKNIEHVARLAARTARSDLDEGFAFADDSFGEEKAGGQLAVVARRSHCDGNALAADSDFQRSLDREVVRSRARFLAESEARDSDGDARGIDCASG